MTIGPRRRRRVGTGVSILTINQKDTTSRAFRAGRAALQGLLNESHDEESPWEEELDPHQDDGWADAELPELGFADDLDLDDPARDIPLRPSPALAKIRWWVVDPEAGDEAQAPVLWAVRGPGVGSSVPAVTLALHEERLAALAEVIARDHADAVRASTLWDALLAFRRTTADELYKRMDQRLPSVSDNLTRLAGTVLHFPWGMTTLGTLTKLSQKGAELPLIEPILDLAGALGDLDHPERREQTRTKATNVEIKAIRLQIATQHGCREDTLLRQQQGLIDILNNPARVLAERACQPQRNWGLIAARLGERVTERLAVMAVAGAFDQELMPLLRRQLDKESA